MATRTKTISYAWPTYTSLVADATLTSIGSITIYIPETTRTFKSVFVEVGFQDVITATGGTIASYQVELTLGAGTPSNKTFSSAITNTGENIAGVIGPHDYTSYFTSDFGAGTSQTVDLKVLFDQSTGTTLGMQNITAIVYITYDYDDSVATQIKTVAIPLESRVNALATTETEIGTNQIPQLTGTGGMLPESSVMIRDYYFVIDSNSANSNNATDWTLTVRIDNEGAGGVAFATQECALATDVFNRWIWSRTSDYPDTTTVHAFKMWSAGIARANHACITLYVTYEFNASTSTRILNSILLPFEVSSPLGLTSSDFSRYQRNFFVSEPGTITLQQSSFRVHWNCNAAVSGLNFRAGSQAYRTYTNAGNVIAGMFCLQQRIDSGSAQGAGITLSRGLNTVTIDGYRTDTTNDPTNINGVIILNYESDKHASGVGVHTHTIFEVMSAWSGTNTDRHQFNFSSLAGETNYYLTGIGFYSIEWQNAASNSITFDVKVLAGESKEAGYLDLYGDAYLGDTEQSCIVIWGSGRDIFKRFPGDMGTDRIDIQATRLFRMFNSTAFRQGTVWVTTYHTMTKTVSGEIVGYYGDGSGITVNIHRSDTHERIGQVTTSAGGTYNFTWYDDVLPLYAVATQGGLAGRSRDSYAV